MNCIFKRTSSLFCSLENWLSFDRTKFYFNANHYLLETITKIHELLFLSRYTSKNCFFSCRNDHSKSNVYMDICLLVLKRDQETHLADEIWSNFMFHVIYRMTPQKTIAEIQRNSRCILLFSPTSRHLFIEHTSNLNITVQHVSNRGYWEQSTVSCEIVVSDNTRMYVERTFDGIIRIIGLVFAVFFILITQFSFWFYSELFS